MLPYCLKFKQKTESKTQGLWRQKNRTIMLLSNCELCNCKTSSFIKEQETTGLLSRLGIKASLSKNYLVVNLLF